MHQGDPRAAHEPLLDRKCLEPLLDPDHTLVRFATAIDWSLLEENVRHSFAFPVEASLLPTRLLVGLSLLRAFYDLSDEALCRYWAENPYYQYFCGESYFQYRAPFDQILVRMLPRISANDIDALLKRSFSHPMKAGEIAGAWDLPPQIAAEPAPPPLPIPKDLPHDVDTKSAKPARIYEVAKLAGVSVKTVSLVLNRHSNVSQRTIEAVHAAIKELSYKPNMFARGLATLRSNLIAVLYDGPGEFISDIEAGALSRCREAGYHLIVESLSANGPDLRGATRKLLAGPTLYGAIVVPPLCDMPEVITELVAAHIHCVRVSPGKRIPGLSTVAVDEYRIGYDMTAHLIGIGHRRIGFISGRPNHFAALHRCDGYRAALLAAGLPVEEELLEEGLFTLESGRSAAERLLDRANRPTAILATSDHMAAGVLGAAQRIGLKVPDDLSVAGVDDSVIAQIVWPQLTTCHQPIAQMGAAAVSLLLQQEQGGGATDLRLDHTLVERGSTAPPPELVIKRR